MATPAASTEIDVSTKLPILGLLALATACFIGMMTEAMPAGLLPQIGADLHVSEALTGQLVTAYAIGSIIAAIPLTAITRGWRRRSVLLLAIGGFFVLNTVTALSTNYAITLTARFFAGVFAGLLWALVAGHASRMAPEHLRGRAIAIAMVGAPIALSLGIPLSAILGQVVGWRSAFGVMSALTVLLLVWVRFGVPDFPGVAASRHRSIRKVFGIPGVKSVLIVTLAYALSHNVIYTYISPFLVSSGMSGSVQTALFVFGVSALVGIWIIGVLVDRWLRELALASVAMFCLASAAMFFWQASPLVIYTSIAAWGLSFGGAGTLFQNASANAAGEAADVAQSIFVTSWNIAIAGGGLVGGAMLTTLGGPYLPGGIALLLVPTFLVVWFGRRHAFPAK
ncbi:MFS transporter [Paraburkholderia hospita]|uniref:MFS transporter n=1 Tax=Paraburkholderia hospita TaxID=169430 RepID=UPI000B346815|nr:MFS transporter [Paraburkholderia hospita]OUL96526.1 MFS transporter [Paraburkholderia hospita]